jgi:serine/threonine protein kinase
VAPEVLASSKAEGNGYDGFKTDVWSLGICLFIMLTGHPLYEVGEYRKRIDILRNVQNQERQESIAADEMKRSSWGPRQGLNSLFSYFYEPSDTPVYSNSTVKTILSWYKQNENAASAGLNAGLIDGMLRIEASERLNLEQVLASPWLA